MVQLFHYVHLFHEVLQIDFPWDINTNQLYKKKLLTCKAVFIEQPMAGNEHKAVKCKFHKRENISAHISLLFILVLVLIAGAL